MCNLLHFTTTWIQFIYTWSYKPSTSAQGGKGLVNNCCPTRMRSVIHCLDYTCGIISWCSTAMVMSQYPYKQQMSTICSSSEATWSFMIAMSSDTPGQCRLVVLWPVEKYQKANITVVYPAGRATETSFPLIDSDKTSTCSSFKFWYSLPFPVHISPLTL